jgi:DHA3 family macrolide efflux protein-like MFS transporter
LKGSDLLKDSILWSNRNFLLLLTADVLAKIGLWFGVIANLQFLIRTVPSDLIRSLVLVSGPLLLIVLSPKAGEIIDRSDKKAVFTVSGFVQLGSAALQVIALAWSSVMLMVAGLLLFHAGNAFYHPSLSSLLPAAVPREQLVEANGIMVKAVTATRILATGLAGIFTAVLPLYGMYLVTCAIYAVMIAVRFLLRVETAPVAAVRRDNSGSFVEVFPLLRSQVPLLVLMASVTLVNLFIGGSNLIILKFSELQHDPALQGWLYAIEGVCILLGGFLVSRYNRRGNLLDRCILLLFGVSASLLIMHTGESQAWIPLIGYACFGFAAGCTLPAFGAIPQLLVPENYRGRYFAFQEMWHRITSQIALLLTGTMFDWIGLSAYLLILAGVIFACAVALMAIVRIRRLTVSAA